MAKARFDKVKKDWVVNGRYAQSGELAPVQCELFDTGKLFTLSGAQSATVKTWERPERKAGLFPSSGVMSNDAD
jgi:hypothetical protein